MFIDPVAELINFCQKNTTSVADATEKWLELLQDGPLDLRPFFGKPNETEQHFKRCHDDDQWQQVTNYIFDKLEGAELEPLREFTKGEGSFANLNRKKFTWPKTFWHFAAQTGHEKLAAFALDYLEIPAFTAQLERLFSKWAYVHSDIRQRLSTETSNKLANVYFALRTTDDTVEDDDQDFEMEVDQFGIVDENGNDE